MSSSPSANQNQGTLKDITPTPSSTPQLSIQQTPVTEESSTQQRGAQSIEQQNTEPAPELSSSVEPSSSSNPIQATQVTQPTTLNLSTESHQRQSRSSVLRHRSQPPTRTRTPYSRPQPRSRSQVPDPLATMSSASSSPGSTTTSAPSAPSNPSYNLPYAPFPYPIPSGSGQGNSGNSGSGK